MALPESGSGTISLQSTGINWSTWLLRLKCILEEKQCKGILEDITLKLKMNLKYKRSIFSKRCQSQKYYSTMFHK